MQKLVVIVDDSGTIRKVVALVFRKTEFTLVTASSGPVALDRLVSLTPDIIVIDAEMPGMDGYALAKRLRMDSKLAETSLLLMVTDAGPDAARLGDTDIDGYVVKPFSSGELLDPVRMLTGTEVRRDVPLSFQQIMASRKAAEEQRRAEMMAELESLKPRSENDELNFTLEEEPPARPAPPPRRSSLPKPRPSSIVPAPRQLSNAAADLDLPPPPPAPPPPPPKREDVEIAFEAPVSAPRVPPIAPPPVVEEDLPPLREDLSPMFARPLARPPSPARPAPPPAQQQQPRPPAQNLPPPPPAMTPMANRSLSAPPRQAPPDEMQPSVSSGGIVEHFAAPVKEPVTSAPLSRPVFDDDSEISEAPQLRPKRTLMWIVVALILVAGAVMIYLNRP
jgi:CheY-like chemotaxis protein